MTDSIVIPWRFRGPPRSANGGYTCGLVAGPLGPGPTEVSLRRPPPIDRPLDLVAEGGTASLRDGDAVIADARPGDDAFDTPPLVAGVAADAAAAAFDVAAYRAGHPFPGCFTCGPDRADGDGLRLFPAPVGDGVVAWPWSPPTELAVDEGRVPTAVVWAALDCPSGLAWIGAEDGEPAVLGRMTAVVHERPRAEDRLVVVGWRVGRDGRRLTAGSAVVRADDGEVLAENRAVWVVLDEDQRAAFASRT